MTTENTENAVSSKTKSALIREEVAKGNTKVSEIRKTLRAAGVEVSENLVYSIKQQLKSTMPPSVGQMKTKKEAILSLYRSGVTKPSDILAALNLQGVKTTSNTIYVVLHEANKAGKRASSPPPMAKTVKPDAPSVHPDLLQLMQVAALQFGTVAVENAAQMVGAQTRQMFKQLAVS